MPILSLSQVTKRYGAITVADAIDLTLGEGEALGVIGPNGAGKTSLFNLIAGTVRVDAGTIRLRNRDVTGLGAAARCRHRVSRSLQNPQTKAGQNLLEKKLVGAAIGGAMSERDAYRKAVDVLDLTGLSPKANALAGSLTLLERKRLEMARAVATGPDLLLLDEIAGGLTEHECRDLVAAIKALRETGLSIIWIEHVVHALLAVVDRLIVIDFGRKIAEGEPQAVMASREVSEIYLGIEADA
jgi:branched-chain amino acid transport system ATP-binding protein